MSFVILPEFVHHCDEKGDCFRDEFARVAFVVLDGDGSLLFDAFQRRGAVQAVATHKHFHTGKLVTLNLKDEKNERKHCRY